MLTEVKYLSTLAVYLSPYNTTSKVYIVVDLRKLGQCLHVVGQGTLCGVFTNSSLMLFGIAVQLTHQYAIGSLGVLIGTVSLEVVLHLSAAIEFIGSS